MILGWDESLSCQNERIDSQHKEIFQRFDAIVECLSNGKNPTVLQNITNSLVNYIGDHFIEEDKTMTRCNYPHTIEHIEEHNSFIKMLNDMSKNLKDDPECPLMHLELIVTLAATLKIHISGTDKKLADYIRTNEPTAQ